MKALPAMAALVAALTAGCAGLPPKHNPVRLQDAAPLEGLLLSGGGEWPDQEWWKRYQDPTLDQLIELGLASSPTLATAHARYDSALQVGIELAAEGERNSDSCC